MWKQLDSFIILSNNFFLALETPADPAKHEAAWLINYLLRYMYSLEVIHSDMVTRDHI